MAQKRKPRRPTVPPVWAIVLGQNTPDYVLIDFQAERFDQVLGNPGASKASVAALKLADGVDQFSGRSFWPWLALGMRGVEEPAFAFLEHAMEAKQGGRFEDHRRTEKPTRAEKASPEPEEEAVKRM
jgi:hypothetical protein